MEIQIDSIYNEKHFVEWSPHSPTNWHIFCYYIWHILAFYLTNNLKFYLTVFAAFYLTSAVEVRQCPLICGAPRMRSGKDHWDLVPVVEVRQCPLRSGDRSWDPRLSGGKKEKEVTLMKSIVSWKRVGWGKYFSIWNKLLWEAYQ